LALDDFADDAFALALDDFAFGAAALAFEAPPEVDRLVARDFTLAPEEDDPALGLDDFLVEVALGLGDSVSFTPSITRAPALAMASAPSTTVAPMERAALLAALAAALPVPTIVPLVLFFA
jgi:hypothetical protein